MWIQHDISVNFHHENLFQKIKEVFYSHHQNWVRHHWWCLILHGVIRPTINSNNSFKLTLTWSRSEYYFGWLVCIDLCKMSNKLFLFLKYLFLIFIIFQLVILFHGFLFFSADVADVGPLNSDWSDLTSDQLENKLSTADRRSAEEFFMELKSAEFWLLTE